MRSLLTLVAVLIVFAMPWIVVAAPVERDRPFDSDLERRSVAAYGAEDPAGQADGDDDDDDDDRALEVRAALASLAASPPTLLLAGAGFCAEPRVQIGTEDGALEELTVFNAGATFVQAGLVTTDPGTYRVIVTCPSDSGGIDVTLGTEGIAAGQSCPMGTVAIGFDLSGTLLCSPREPVTGECPCITPEELAALVQIIRDSTAGEPDNSALSCQIANDFIAIDFGTYPASGDTPTEVDVFARADICGVRTWLPGEGVVERYITPIAPDEAAACSALILDAARGLDCL